MSIAIEVTWDEIPTPNEKKLSNIMTSNTPKKSFAMSFFSRVISSKKGDKIINCTFGNYCFVQKQPLRKKVEDMILKVYLTIKIKMKPFFRYVNEKDIPSSGYAFSYLTTNNSFW